ncbi:unnamed protein product [Rhizophagus irregularis]|uniref:Uncharacterized protein n=1 Tax=Rhizophagus irregularis TaxID=588596 RepID=A0A2I1F431_9GLOM|nr:hypothetical protein RhiirB3_391569 [Rhizophagus irregularis]CAB5389700.1 unnamed protein product [Rhizophagus irregularis]
MQSQIQNFGKPTINSTSFTTNTPFSPQLDNTLNVSSYINDARDIPVAIDNMLQVSPIITQLSMPPTQLNMNENQAFNIQEMIPRHTLQPMQVYQQMPLQSPHPPLLTHSQKTDIISEYSFFYAPCNDFQTYHIICKEIPFNFESVSQLISNTNNNLMNNYVQPNNIFMFYHEQPEIKKIYQVTCEMVSHTFLSQYLNKIIYNIQFVNYEYQQQEFSNRQQENLKFHLKKDLVHYLAQVNIYDDNYNVQKRFIQDYRTYESMINSNTYIPPNHSNIPFPFDQSYTSQQDNNCQMVSSQNNGN